jgi:hypothetical protein
MEYTAKARAVHGLNTDIAVYAESIADLIQLKKIDENIAVEIATNLKTGKQDEV